MALVLGEPPKEGLSVVSEAVKLIAMQQGGMEPDLKIAPPQEVYELTLEDLAAGGTVNAAKPVACAD